MAGFFADITQGVTAAAEGLIRDNPQVVNRVNDFVQNQRAGIEKLVENNQPLLDKASKSAMAFKVDRQRDAANALTIFGPWMKEAQTRSRLIMQEGISRMPKLVQGAAEVLRDVGDTAGEVLKPFLAILQAELVAIYRKHPYLVGSVVAVAVFAYTYRIILRLLGFGRLSPIAGRPAARIQATYPNVRAGSMFA